jgi:hypothetical protein
VQVGGFPSTYVPGQAYTISVSHSGGTTIKQINTSCRIGAGSANAGTLAAGSNTITYSTTGETNGIHLSVIDVDAANFTWTAPAAGTGDVRLYLCGHQGTYSGQNTELILTATEQTDAVFDPGPPPVQFWLGANQPNPFREATVIGFSLPQPGLVRFEVFDLSGRLLQSQEGVRAAGHNEFAWNAGDHPSGVYFYRVRSGAFSETKRMLLIR